MTPTMTGCYLPSTTGASNGMLSPENRRKKRKIAVIPFLLLKSLTLITMMYCKVKKYDQGLRARLTSKANH